MYESIKVQNGPEVAVRCSTVDIFVTLSLLFDSTMWKHPRWDEFYKALNARAHFDDKLYYKYENFAVEVARQLLEHISTPSPDSRVIQTAVINLQGKDTVEGTPNSGWLPCSELEEKKFKI